MSKQVVQYILASKKKGKKLFALLIDPDKFDPQAVDVLLRSKPDLFLVGGSLITNGNFEHCIAALKKKSKTPVIIFPGNSMQLSNAADGILFLSLISGRNPEMLIGNHVHAAPMLAKSKLEIIPTGYLLIDGGKTSAAAYMSHTLPIPADKFDIASCTALAGEMLGMQLIYLEGGSGAAIPVNKEMISAVRKAVSVPLIVGGGIRTAKDARDACSAGADIIVIGTAAEKNITSVPAIAKAIHSFHL